MLEATLFGHERGAFTGAHVAREGKFEMAQGGTLLLDEISEIEPSLQAKLLRVLQEREVERVGGKSPIELDVRIIATTNRDLLDCAKRGLFREDLYYRMSVFPIHLPPLRSRPEDILPLARHFVQQSAGGDRLAPGLSRDASEALLKYAWPGNVRELQNVMDRALILADGPNIRARDLQFEMLDALASPVEPTAAASEEPDLKSNLRTVEERLVIDALEASGGNRKQAAEILGVSARTLRYKIARLREVGIGIPDARSGVGSD
jgi:two-component system response regulator FlrC